MLGKFSSYRPKVSVAMASYNSEKYIAEAVESILNQTLRNFELIIVDDCSSDNTWKIINQFSKRDRRIRIYKNSNNLGGCKTLNKAMGYAKGKYIAVMDNDDWSYPYRLLKQSSFLDKHPEVGIVGGTMEITDRNLIVKGQRKYDTSDGEIRNNIFRHSPFSHPLIMLRKTVVDIVGYGKCEFAPADDYELYFRIGTISKFANIKEVLIKYRVLNNSITHNQTKLMIKKTLLVRNLYKNRLGYKIKVHDLILCYLMVIATFLPTRLILFLFNKVRNS